MATVLGKHTEIAHLTVCESMDKCQLETIKLKLAVLEYSVGEGQGLAEAAERAQSAVSILTSATNALKDTMKEMAGAIFDCGIAFVLVCQNI